MVENWITPEIIRNSVRRNLIYLTQNDAITILRKLNQQEAYDKASSHFEVKVWDGRLINGVDVSKGRKRKNGVDPSDVFVMNGTGHAYIIEKDGKIIGYQPHVPGIMGMHALTSKTIPHPITHAIVDKCPTCEKEHDIETIMNEHIVDIIKGNAASELMTKALYMAQEIFDARMNTIDKISQSMV